MDSLKRRVLAFDRERNTPRQMDVTSRDVETKRICIECRRSPSYEQYLANWLEAHPPTDPNHVDEWETEEIVRCLPPYSAITRCPWCDGRLVDVTW